MKVKIPFTVEVLFTRRLNRHDAHSQMMPAQARLRDALGHVLGKIWFPPNKDRFGSGNPPSFSEWGRKYSREHELRSRL